MGGGRSKVKEEGKEGEVERRRGLCLLLLSPAGSL